MYRSKDAEGTLPLIVNMHGGASAMRAEMFPAIDARLAMQGALVASVDYRIVPEHPYPCGVEDCYAALCWAVDTLDIDKDRVVVTGAERGRRARGGRRTRWHATEAGRPSATRP